MLAWQIVRYRPRLSAVTVFPEGVAWSDGDGWRGVPWGKLKRLYRSEIKLNSMWKTRELRLEWGEDKITRPPAGWKSAGRLWNDSKRSRRNLSGR